MHLSSRKLKHEGTLELSMTSMIDVVFLLLIFFMTTISFRVTERDLTTGVQVKREARERLFADLEPAVVEIINVDGRFLYALGSRQMDTLNELRDVLKRFPGKGAGAYVRVRDEVPFDMAASAVQACHDAKFPSVYYVAIPDNP